MPDIDRRILKPDFGGDMLRLYDNKESRNGYKVVLLLNHLGTRYERIEVDIFSGGSRTAAYLAKAPAGKIPALELDDGTVLVESGAILWYLADGTSYLPADKLARAKLLSWICFEQNAHETSIAESRFILNHPELSKGRAGVILEEKQRRGNAALKLMDEHLAGNAFFVGGSYTIADMALYGYTSVADEGGFDLANYPAVQAWMERVAAQPGYVAAGNR
ncbi:MAG: glutathione S-transferase family protein [Alphaproteobacteria bacterium]